MAKLKLNKHEREVLKNKFCGRCAYCGCVLNDKWHADHIEPVIRISANEMLYPENDSLRNLVPACHPCNLHKHSNDLENYRRIINDGRREFLKSGKGKALVRMSLVQVSEEPVVFWFEKFNSELQSTTSDIEKEVLNILRFDSLTYLSAKEIFSRLKDKGYKLCDIEKAADNLADQKLAHKQLWYDDSASFTYLSQ